MQEEDSDIKRLRPAIVDLLCNVLVPRRAAAVATLRSLGCAADPDPTPGVLVLSESANLFRSIRAAEEFPIPCLYSWVTGTKKTEFSFRCNNR